MIRLRGGEGEGRKRVYESTFFVSCKKKGYEGERTSPWALKKLNWTNARKRAREMWEREKWPAWEMAFILPVHGV